MHVMHLLISGRLLLGKTKLILAMDQGTTSSRALVFEPNGHIASQKQAEFAQHYPANGWVEHSPQDILKTSLETATSAVQQAEAQGARVVSIGITNQRETVVIWDRDTGRPIHNALVWQDRRTADTCAQMQEAGLEAEITERTGLLLDPYFSATKIAWILDNIEGARGAAQAGKLAFGTVDSFLIWHLTGGAVHATDETNASRTMLFNIHTGTWDTALLEMFNIPAVLLPRVLPSAALFGHTDPAIFGRAIPIQGVAGDQQAAAFGQGCHKAGMAKSTYGTGCFLLMHTGSTALSSGHRLLTTRACRTDGPPQYALEGSIFMAGAVAQWLRDGLDIIETSPQSEAIAAQLDSNDGVYLVPAFTGLGAPYWDPQARGAIYGLTRQTGRAQLVRAALESVAYQTQDLVLALQADGAPLSQMRIDGGMSQNNWLAQFISDMCATELLRPANIETTALGAAWLAGIEAGLWPSDHPPGAHSDAPRRFTPTMKASQRETLLREWDIAVRTTRYRETLRQA